MRGLLSAHMMKRSTALGLLLLTALLWSTGGLFIKLISWHPVAIAGSRSAIAALLFFLLMERRRPRWSWQLAAGALAYSATVIFFVLATKTTTAANAILLQYTAPVYVALFGAWLLKERTRPADWVVIAVVVLGMAMFFLDDITAGDRLGNIFAIISGISFATMIVFLRLQKDASPVESVFWGNLLTAVICLPFMRGPLPDINGLAALLILGVFQLGLSYLFYTAAIRHVTALEGILIPTLEPLFNPLWVFLFIGEQPGLWALAGGIVIIATVTIRCIASARQQPQEALLPPFDSCL
jgi:drug/metabolite transporter (DMT)-like permease